MLPIVCGLLRQVFLKSGTLMQCAHRNLLALVWPLLLCLCIVVVGEYRLTTLGLVYAIAAAVLTETSATLYEAKQYSRYPLDSLLLCCLGLGVTGVFALFGEDHALPVLLELDSTQIACLSINVSAAAVAINLEQSLILPLSTRGKLGGLIPILTLTGCTGCASLLLTQRSYTTALQLISYAGAAVHLGYMYMQEEQKRQLRALEDLPFRVRIPHSGTIEASADSPGHFVDPMLHNPSTVTRSTHRVFPGPLQACYILFVVAVWSVFVFLNFFPAQRASDRVPPLLDWSFHPHVSTAVVVSMYDEPLTSVSALVSSVKQIPSLLDASVYVYTKAPGANVSLIQHHTGATEVIHLPNMGREGGTYLHHILTRWDSLAGHTLFVQATMHNERQALLRIRSYFDSERTGMLSLGSVGQITACNGSDQWGWSDRSGIVPYVYEHVYHGPCQRILLSYKGQFIVSAKRIRGIGQGLYRELYGALVEESSWAHRELYLHGSADTMSAPFFGYTIERLWNVLFQCSDMRVAWKCPTLLSGVLSGVRQWGGVDDCQCIDR